jgi:hypothetical protein
MLQESVAIWRWMSGAGASRNALKFIDHAG